MWDIYFSVEEVKQQARNVLMRKTVRFQTEYMGIRKTRINLYGVPLDAAEEHLGAFFMTYGSLVSISPILRKSGFATSEFALQVTVTREAFLNILNVLICFGRSIYVAVERKRPC